MSKAEITAEGFSSVPADLERQAGELAQLAEQDAEWLQAVRPVTLANFSNQEVAAASMRRVVEARTMCGLILRRGKAAVGLGTIVSSLTIFNPACFRELLSGDQIDYWTVADVSPDEHEAAARALLAKTRTPAVLGILSRKEASRATGIPAVMQPVGAPGKVRVPLGKPDYGLSAVRQPLQVYTHQHQA